MDPTLSDLDVVAQPRQQADLPTHQLPNQYVLMEKVSEGGMGSIYKAQNRFTGAEFAIKLLRPEFANDERAAQRFAFEAKSAMSLRHPNICRVHDFGLTEAKVPYLVMDWVNGISLGSKILRDRRLPIKEAIRLYQQTASALAHAHQSKLVHRDLKPENLMLSRDAEGRSEVQLVDFGIAKSLDAEDGLQAAALTKTGLIVGTPVYMSPEQARAEQVDGRTDIYSLACVIFFALTGRPPFLGPTVVDTITKHLIEAPPDFNPSLKVPSDLQKIIYKSLEKDPCQRYNTMEEVLADLMKLTAGVSLNHKPLSRDRQRVRSRLTLLVWFTLGFITMYAISIGLQTLMGDGGGDSGLTKNNKAAPTNHPSTKRS